MFRANSVAINPKVKGILVFHFFFISKVFSQASLQLAGGFQGGQIFNEVAQFSACEAGGKARRHHGAVAGALLDVGGLDGAILPVARSRTRSTVLSSLWAKPLSTRPSFVITVVAA